MRFDKKPLLKKGVLTIICERIEAIGAISNITPFGCFVDIAVEKVFLLHVSKFKGFLLKIIKRIPAIVGREFYCDWCSKPTHFLYTLSSDFFFFDNIRANAVTH